MPFITSIFTYLVAKFGISSVKAGILTVLKVTSWVFFLASIYFAVDGITSVISLIESSFDNLSSLGGGSSIVTGVLSASGVFQGMAIGFPFVSSAITFVVGVALHNMIMQVRNKLEADVKDMLKLI